MDGHLLRVVQGLAPSSYLSVSPRSVPEQERVTGSSVSPFSPYGKELLIIEEIYRSGRSHLWSTFGLDFCIPVFSTGEKFALGPSADGHSLPTSPERTLFRSFPNMYVPLFPLLSISALCHSHSDSVTTAITQLRRSTLRSSGDLQAVGTSKSPVSTGFFFL